MSHAHIQTTVFAICRIHELERALAAYVLYQKSWPDFSGRTSQCLYQRKWISPHFHRQKYSFSANKCSLSNFFLSLLPHFRVAWPLPLPYTKKRETDMLPSADLQVSPNTLTERKETFIPRLYLNWRNGKQPFCTAVKDRK